MKKNKILALSLMKKKMPPANPEQNRRINHLCCSCLEMESRCWFFQAGLQFLSSGYPPALFPSVARTTGAHHHTQMQIFFNWKKIITQISEGCWED